MSDKALELAARLTLAASAYSSANTAKARALAAETKAARAWTEAAAAHGVGSAQEIAALADWETTLEEVELNGALLGVARFAFRRMRREIPAPAGGAQA